MWYHLLTKVVVFVSTAKRDGIVEAVTKYRISEYVKKIKKKNIPLNVIAENNPTKGKIIYTAAVYTNKEGKEKYQDILLKKAFNKLIEYDNNYHRRQRKKERS